MLTFRMNCSVKMNRKVDREKDYISPGGYVFNMANKVISFDFENYSVGIDKDNPSIIHIEGKCPDVDVYPELLNVTPDMLARIIEIPEFFIFTGEPGETDLKPVKLLKCGFCLPYEDWRTFLVPPSICKNAVMCSNIM